MVRLAAASGAWRHCTRRRTRASGALGARMHFCTSFAGNPGRRGRVSEQSPAKAGTSLPVVAKLSALHLLLAVTAQVADDCRAADRLLRALPAVLEREPEFVLGEERC